MASTYVYFIKPVGVIGPIKVGCSRTPGSRIMAMATWSPFQLELLACIHGGLDLEKKIHDRFFPYHIRHEWFEPVDELVRGIANIASGVAVDEAFDLLSPRGNLKASYVRGSADWLAIRKARPELFRAEHLAMHHAESTAA